MNTFGSALMNAVNFNRNNFAESLPDTGVIQSPAESQSNQGTTINNWTDVATVPCRLESADASETTEQERLIAEKLTGKALFRIRFAFGTSIEIGHRIVIAGRIFKFVSVSTSQGFSVGVSTLAIEFI